MSDFGRTLLLLLYFMCANSEGSGETAQMRRLAWAFAGRLCDKYHNPMSWLKLWIGTLLKSRTRRSGSPEPSRYGTFHPPSSNAFAHPSSGARCLILVGPFFYFYTSCVRTAKALARLRRCAGSPEPSLVAYVISTIISWAGTNCEQVPY